MDDDHDTTTDESPDEASIDERWVDLKSCTTVRYHWVLAALFLLLLLILSVHGLCDWMARRLLSLPHQPPYDEIGLLCSGIIASICVVSALSLIWLRVHMFLIILPLVEWMVISRLTAGVGMISFATFALCFFSFFYIGSLVVRAIQRKPGPEDSPTIQVEYMKCSLDFFSFRMVAYGWILLACYFYWMPQMEHYAGYDYDGPMYLSRMTGGKEEFPHYWTAGEESSNNDTIAHELPRKNQFLEVSWGSYWGCPEHPHTQCSVSFDYQPVEHNLFKSYPSNIFEQFLKLYNSTTDMDGEVPTAAVEIPGEMMWPLPQQNQDIWIQGNCGTCTIPNIRTEEATKILSEAIYAIVFGALLRAIFEVGYRRYASRFSHDGSSVIEFELVAADESWVNGDNRGGNESKFSVDFDSEDETMNII